MDTRLASWFLVLSFIIVPGNGEGGIVFDFNGNHQEQRPGKCRASKAMWLLQVNCSGRDLEQIPEKLDSGLQVLDLTYNRLEELPAGSFSRYTSLEYLYLSKNFLSEITEDTVDELSYLQVLDLTMNQKLSILPPSLFQLPYLRKLYLRKNKIQDSVLKTEVTSPLNYLEVTLNGLTKIPSMGPLPSLTFMNLSQNSIKSISAEDLAPYCSLNDLILTKNDIRFDLETCDCYKFNSWIQLRQIKVTPSFPCDNSTFERCQMEGFSNNTLNSYKNCLDLIEVQKAALKAKSTWTIVGSCVCAFFVCLLVGFYCLYKRNKKMTSRKIKEQQKLAANNANTELLNSNLPEEISAKTLHD